LETATSRQTVALACALVLAAFCKFPVGFVFLISAPFALLMMPAHDRHRWLERSNLRKLSMAYLPIVSLLIAVAFVAATQWRRGQPLGFGFEDFAGVGLGRYQNVATALGIPKINLLDELSAQLSWPVVVLATIGLCVSAIFADWRFRWLIAMGLIPM